MIGLSPQSWDSFVTRYTFKVLKYVNWEIDPLSKLTGSWFAVESPTFLISSILIYLVVVLGSCYCNSDSYGKKRKEDPFLIRVLVIFHNLFLVILSLYMCGGCILEAKRNSFKIWGNPYDPGQVKLARYIYIFYISKIYEFLDTFIMIIKKNFKQVSFFACLSSCNNFFHMVDDYKTCSWRRCLLQCCFEFLGSCLHVFLLPSCSYGW